MLSNLFNMETKLLGSPLPWPFMDDRGFPIDPDMPVLSAADREAIDRIFKQVRSELPNKVGQILILGTMGDMEGGEDFEKLWVEQK